MPDFAMRCRTHLKGGSLPAIVLLAWRRKPEHAANGELLVLFGSLSLKSVRIPASSSPKITENSARLRPKSFAGADFCLTKEKPQSILTYSRGF